MRFAQQNHVPHWQFLHQGQPRTAVGFSFSLLAAILVRLGLIPDFQLELKHAAQFMHGLQEELQPHLPVAKNRARRDAGQLIGRWPVVFGTEHLAPVAVRWKSQINELAKTWAQADFLPEADHNSLAGLVNPEEHLMRTTAIFLTAPSLHPRNQKRMELTRQAFMQQGIGTDQFIAPGRTRLEQMWSAIQYGDYLAYYLALAYGVDPTPVDILEDFKNALKDS
jgi:glucose/mannose-6-phosphate isomerase